MKLTPEAVHTIMTDCLYREDELTRDDAGNFVTPKDAIVVQGITSIFGLHPQRVTAHRLEIKELLEELSDDFKEGMSFLRLPLTKDDELWGEHGDAQALMVLGIAAGLMRYLTPREMWGILPGGMPYLEIMEEV